MTFGMHLLLHAAGHAISHSRRQRQQQQTFAYTYPFGYAHPASNVAYNNFTTIQAQPTSDDGYNATASRRTGYVQVVCGVLSVIIGIAAIVLQRSNLWLVIPIWSAFAFFIVAGILGIASARKQTKCLIVGHLVMSILALLAAFQMMCLMIVAAVVGDGDNGDLHPTPYGESRLKLNLYLLCGLACTVALFEFSIAIIAAAVGYNGGRTSDIVATQEAVSQMPQPMPNQSNLTVITNPGTMAAHPGYIHQPHGYPVHAYNNQGFNMPPQAFQGFPTMPPPGAPPADLPPSYEYGNAGGVPMPQA